MAAIELAKDDSDLAAAADEFHKAVTIDPAMASGWFNLAAVEVKLGRFEEAMAHYQRYLELAPQAEDAGRIRDELVKLEFRLERVRTAQSRAGTWVASDGTFYDLAVEGDRITLHAGRRFVTKRDVKASYTLMGAQTIDPETHDFRLTLRGDKLQGTWTRQPIKADKCVVPEETAEVKGVLEDRESRMVLRFTRSSYLAPTHMSIMENDRCGGVTVTRRREVELSLRGPLADGGVSGVRLNLHDDDLDGWREPLIVTRVKEGSAAQAAGIQEKDVIVAIDGVSTKGLSEGECLWRLRGKPGAAVKLLVQRQGAAEPIPVALLLEREFRVP
jgi:hypothetical protein